MGRKRGRGAEEEAVGMHVNGGEESEGVGVEGRRNEGKGVTGRGERNKERR